MLLIIKHGNRWNWPKLFRILLVLTLCYETYSHWNFFHDCHEVPFLKRIQQPVLHIRSIKPHQFSKLVLLPVFFTIKIFILPDTPAGTLTSDEVMELLGE